MARDLAPLLPPPLASTLREDVDRTIGFTVLLITAPSAGWPRVSMISPAELFVVDPGRLTLALWPSSTAAVNLGETGRATLAAVVGKLSFVVHAGARPTGDILLPLSGWLACFELTVRAATADEAPYAELVSGVRFRLPDQGSVLPRWRELRAELARAGALDAPQ